ncbi:hypothetical protein B0T26DRAFT_447860 [Lasiosphaeria miniovina]|uniref:LsmAD domain-containing protein n=1 Tax=Lasiosphaeria miniovina TaxID=1954250 RepID=A0AA40DJX1_9PEZI|nr:uncharacterized protein B0T26DRAFT_447860 [Lasiosphaeria miniovina]KAK0706339.1 hypothetical protein B0T26DRAFT_447860 [Lasiosphaeria miniovina]
MVTQKKIPNGGEIANGAGRKEQLGMTFQRKEITDARVVSGNTGNRSSFRTDSAISNVRIGSTDRVLKPWVPDAGSQIDESLEKSATTGKPWNQFEENERLFGVHTDYDESIYTSAINKQHPEYKERMAMADRITREIQQTAPATSHVAEERVMDFSGGGEDQGDEEAKYSGVRRQDFPPLSTRETNKHIYTPPARRAPTGQATVKGAPVDPAIISSQLKIAPTPKLPTPKVGETNSSPQPDKTRTSPVAQSTPVEPKAEKQTSEEKALEDKKEVKPSEQVPEKPPTSARPSAATSRTTTKDSAPNATATVEQDVLASFKSFATRERNMQEYKRMGKARADKEVKLIELKKFSTSFKLSTPVPKDLISIIAKDPAKQKQIQEKALQNAEEMAKVRASVDTSVPQKDTPAAIKESQPKTTAEQSTPLAVPASVESRTTSRPTAPQHSSSQPGVPSRHPGGRASYNNQPHYQYNRNGRTLPHMAPQNQQTGNLAQRLRTVEQQKLQHPHMGQHAPLQDIRLPPTGPANSVDASYGRRISGAPSSYLGPKLNPNSHEFRPNSFATSTTFNPSAVSQSSSPRSSVNNIVEATLAPTPVAGQLIRRKTKAVDVKKCFILSHIQTIQPPPPRNWDDNDGIRPPYETIPTWRQLQDETESPDSTMHLTYKKYFERSMSNAPTATPNPSHVMPQIPHPHHPQIPFHLQLGAQNLAPRQSPHMPPMQMHNGQHGHVHVPFSNSDDHRMMHSNSAQSFASPRMTQITMAYAPALNAPAQIPYSQPVMQPYMNPGAPQMGFRSFSNNPQFLPQQQPHHMAAQMMVQPQYMTAPNGMVAAGPQVPMYPGPPFMPPGAVPPQSMAGSMAGSTGFPSPGRPAATMMVHQGSHQGQAPVYGMSPGMQYQQPAYAQQPQGKFSGQRPQ